MAELWLSRFGKRPVPFSEFQAHAGSELEEVTGPNPGSAGSKF